MWIIHLLSISFPFINLILSKKGNGGHFLSDFFDTALILNTVIGLNIAYLQTTSAI